MWFFFRKNDWTVLDKSLNTKSFLTFLIYVFVVRFRVRRLLNSNHTGEIYETFFFCTRFIFLLNNIILHIHRLMNYSLFTKFNSYVNNSSLLLYYCRASSHKEKAWPLIITLAQNGRAIFSISYNQFTIIYHRSAAPSNIYPHKFYRHRPIPIRALRVRDTSGVAPYCLTWLISRSRANRTDKTIPCLPLLLSILFTFGGICWYEDFRFCGCHVGWFFLKFNLRKKIWLAHIKTVRK